MSVEIGTEQWALTRDWTNWSEGSAEALRLMTLKLKAGIPQCHVRFADGEFWSIMGRVGPNADGQEHLPHTLGIELRKTLFAIGCLKDPNVLVGGYWDIPVSARQWLVKTGCLEHIQWCPVQVFVTGIDDDTTMDFLNTIRQTAGRTYLVANSKVAQLAESFGARPLIVTLPEKKLQEITHNNTIYTPNTPGWYGEKNAYTDMPEVVGWLKMVLSPGDKVIWCGGLGCKPALYRMYREYPGTSHFDMGCFFDLAAGLVSRTWMTSPPDARQQKYLDEYAPRLRGERPW